MLLKNGINVDVMASPGFARSPPLMIAGGRVFVFPCIQQIQR